MKNQILEFERKIEALEKKVSDLENYNKNLRDCLMKNVKFSTDLSKITYEMDCLLVRKSEEIRDLEKKLEQSLAPVNSVEHDFKIEDFDIEMTSEKMMRSKL